MTGLVCVHNGESKRRCEDCRKKAREGFNTRVRWRRQVLAEDPGLRPHGSVETYRDWGCRCEPCRAAARNERYRYAYKARAQLGYERRTTIASDTPPFGREWVDGATA